MNNKVSKTLYRNKEKGKIAGICAGIADYFNFEIWLVRVIAVSVFLLGGAGLICILYVALWMILDLKPKEATWSHVENGLKKKVWQAGEPAKQALRDISGQFNTLELRLQQIEKHITSEQFDLKRQINNL